MHLKPEQTLLKTTLIFRQFFGRISRALSRNEDRGDESKQQAESVHSNDDVKEQVEPTSSNENVK